MHAKGFEYKVNRTCETEKKKVKTEKEKKKIKKKKKKKKRSSISPYQLTIVVEWVFELY